MLTPLVMPKLGLTMREGTVLEWRCAEGEVIQRGQPILLIESEKVEFEVEAPGDGVVRALITPVGETVPCGRPIAVLSESADEPFDRDAFLAELRARPAPAERRAGAATSPGGRAARAAAGSSSAGETPRASPRARKLAEREGIDVTTLAGSGPGGRVTEEDVQAAIEALGPSIRVDGARIGYIDEGQGATPILFLIGFGLDRSGWNLQLRHFGANGRVLALDPRGTGASSDPDGEPASVERLARDALALLDARGVERADLVGSSLGAAVALEMALAEPARVRKLVLLNPALEPDARLAAALDSIRRVAELGDPELRMRVAAAWTFGPRLLADGVRAERAIRSMLGAVERVPARTLTRQAEALGAWLGARREALGKLAVQALVVAGADDVLTPPQQARALVALLPDARLEILDAVAHAPMVESPDALHALIESFLSRQA